MSVHVGLEQKIMVIPIPYELDAIGKNYEWFWLFWDWNSLNLIQSTWMESKMNKP
jgi:hypothetical protein